MECYDKALEINSNYADAWLNKGELFTDLKRTDKAVECYNQAIMIYNEIIKTNMNNAEALTNKGVALYRLGKHKEAVDVYDTVLLYVNSNYIKAWYNKGLAYYDSAVAAFDKTERYYMALNCYDRCIDINPNYIDALTSKGWVLYDLGRYHEAIECYDKAILAIPDTDKSLIYFSRGESTYSINGDNTILDEMFEKLRMIDIG